MSLKEEILGMAEKIYLYGAEMLERGGSVPWMALIVTMDASPGGSYQAEVLSLPENKKEAKNLIVSKARAANAVAVIMLGEAYMTKLTERNSEKFEVFYAALRLYDESLAIKAARIVRENGKPSIRDRISLGHTEEGRIIANILPSWNARAYV